MKKIISTMMMLIVALALVLSFAGCESAEEDKVTTIYTKEWEKNEFTAVIPKPVHGDVDYVQHFSNDKHYAVHLTNISKDEIASYIETVKASGFKVTHEDANSISTGVTLSGEGVSLSIAYSDNSLSIMVALDKAVEKA